MRIISGKFRSRSVYTTHEKNNCLKGNLSGFRPTTDRAKETLFNVLNNLIDFESTVCLDLFAGSGAIAFEFLSRGALRCDLVENSAKQINSIRKTAKELECNEQIRIYESNVMAFLGSCRDFYDIIFADPPYVYEYYPELINEIFKLEFSIFILEHTQTTAVPHKLNGFEVLNKKAGITNFTIFNRL